MRRETSFSLVGGIEVGLGSNGVVDLDFGNAQDLTGPAIEVDKVPTVVSRCARCLSGRRVRSYRSASTFSRHSSVATIRTRIRSIAKAATLSERGTTRSTAPSTCSSILPCAF